MNKSTEKSNVGRNITGEQFAKELLRILGVSDNKCIVVTEKSNKASETVFSIKNTSKIILREDSNETRKIITATHEVGHFINNSKNIVDYKIFKMSGVTLIALTVIAILMVLFDEFLINISTIFLFIVFIIGFCFSIWSNQVKVRDEDGANKAAFKVLEEHSDEIFNKYKDSRSWELIRKEAKIQLESGTVKYKDSNYILNFVSLLPFILFIFFMMN
ncbi:zinc metallopeptidase [Bacillus sp. ISL-53]|nr:zinc metallopeptidase [Bacillus sp. ISL-53]